MKRNRRTFTNQFKNEACEAITKGTKSFDQVSSENNISKPLLQRWLDAYLAKQAIGGHIKIDRPIERRKDYQSVQDLKAKIADLYMYIEKLEKRGLTYKSPLQQSAEA